MKYTETAAIEAGNPAMTKVVAYVDIEGQRWVIGACTDGTFATWQIGVGFGCNTGHYGFTFDEALHDMALRAGLKPRK